MGSHVVNVPVNAKPRPLIEVVFDRDELEALIDATTSMRHHPYLTDLEIGDFLRSIVAKLETAQRFLARK